VQQPEIAALHDTNFGFLDKKLRPGNRVLGKLLLVQTQVLL